MKHEWKTMKSWGGEPVASREKNDNDNKNASPLKSEFPCSVEKKKIESDYREELGGDGNMSGKRMLDK